MEMTRLTAFQLSLLDAKQNGVSWNPQGSLVRLTCTKCGSYSDHAPIAAANMMVKFPYLCVRCRGEAPPPAEKSASHPECDRCGKETPRKQLLTWVDPINWESMIVCLECLADLRNTIDANEGRKA